MFWGAAVRSVRLAAALLACVAAAPCLAEPSEAIPYAEVARAANGSIVRVWPLFGGATPGAKAYRILYRSTGLNGEPIPVTAAVVFPETPPPEGRPVVAWAHPTTGVAPQCAPTLLPLTRGSIQGLDDMIARGFVVVATDYPGLGAGDMHPYLIGVSEARAVLDSVRAVRQLREAGARREFAVWGHSQGGHAALFTGELAASYAPELKLVGVAVAAPATYLAKLFKADQADGTGSALTAMTLISWSSLFGLPLGNLVAADRMDDVRRVANDCIETIPQFIQEMQDTQPLERGFLKADPTALPSWRAIMDRNTPGQKPAGAPVFLAQGTADTTVHPEITRLFRAKLCRGGTAVKYVQYAGVTHTFIARDSAHDAIEWMQDRFKRKAAPNTCFAVGSGGD
jgi:acetyl esterase/lipase